MPALRRKRNPDKTREAILEAARLILALDGKEGLSVAQVAQRAGVNRGTAYHHFQTREQLVEGAAVWVSEKLYRSVYDDPAYLAILSAQTGAESFTMRLAEFAMENPELGRVWLFELLRSQRPATDQFWRQYASNFERFAQSDLAPQGIDAEVVSVFMLAGTFLWPVWAKPRARNARERKQQAKRFARELIRLSLHGTIRPGAYGAIPRP